MISHMRRRDIGCILSQQNKITGLQGMTTGLNIEIDPTLTAVRTDKREDFPDGSLAAGDEEFDPGVTFRWGITPNLILNATANPDFSQVEADVAQLDINTKFALYYPEKRPFFLEEADRVPASLLVYGTTTEVEEYCRELIKDCAEGGGFILATECETPWDSKRENVRAIIESAMKYGQY